MHIGIHCFAGYTQLVVKCAENIRMWLQSDNCLTSLQVCLNLKLCTYQLATPQLALTPNCCVTRCLCMTSSSANPSIFEHSSSCSCLHKGSNVPFNLANTSVHLKQFITSNLTKDASQLILHGACLCMCVCNEEKMNDLFVRLRVIRLMRPWEPAHYAIVLVCLCVCMFLCVCVWFCI